MLIDGILKKWNDDRGFGFISPDQGGPEVFVHISAFPKSAQRPRLGERLAFEIEIDKNGKKRAKNIRCPDRSIARRVRSYKPSNHYEEKSLYGRIVALIVVVALFVYSFDKYSHNNTPKKIATIAAVATPSSIDEATSPSFRCDGRTHCSQMTSCNEAKYFLRNCPNVEMDGDNDGEPCETQWCTYLFSQ